jgi:hypothetical protein
MFSQMEDGPLRPYAIRETNWSLADGTSTIDIDEIHLSRYEYDRYGLELREVKLLDIRIRHKADASDNLVCTICGVSRI